MSTVTHVEPITKRRASVVLGMLWRDKFATLAVLFLIVVVLCAIFGPALLGEAATDQNLRGRNAPPFDVSRGWLFFLGGDALGTRRGETAAPSERVVEVGEAAVQARRARHRIRADEASRVVAGPAHALGERDVGGRERFGGVVPDPVLVGQPASEERRVRGPRLGGVHDGVLDEDALAREPVERGRLGRRVPVGPDAVGAQGVDRDEQQVGPHRRRLP